MMKNTLPKLRNNPNWPFARIHLPRKLIFTIGFILIGLTTFAQKITFKAQNMSLEQSLQVIRQQSGIDFVYDIALVKGQRVDVDLSNADIDQALKACFKNLPISYARVKNTVVLSAKEGNTTAPDDVDLKGQVLDQDGAPLEGATVVVGGKRKTYTDAGGHFALANIDENAEVRISYTGYKVLILTAAKVKQVKRLRLKPEANMLRETVISASSIGKEKGSKIDLTNRQHLNLSQVLQGTVPGLTIKADRQVVNRDLIDASKSNVSGRYLTGLYTIEEYHVLNNEIRKQRGLRTRTLEEIKREYQEDRNDNLRSGRVKTGTQYIDQGVYPEMRGQSSFPGGGKGMLVVIDGFVQENFPADYPVSNIASIEVLRDPAQTTKWGPQAANGVILITTTTGKSGKLRVNYSFNGSYSKPANNSPEALGLANSAQLLDYYREADDRGLLLTSILPPASPAQRLIFQRRTGQFYGREELFDLKWDSLARLSNTQQLKLLQQPSLGQNHSLSLSGASSKNRYNYSINGAYNNYQTEALGNSSRSLLLNSRGRFSLLKNKMQVSLLLNLSGDRNVAGSYFDPNRLEPYQLLLNPDGSYVRDYAAGAYSEDESSKLLASKKGYVETGANPLEDARSSHDTRRNGRLATQLNLDYSPLAGLTWSTNLQYNGSRGKNRNFLGWENSQTRQRYNQNASYDKTTKTATFYMPQGDILKTSSSSMQSLNLRSALNFQKAFGSGNQHSVKAVLGFAAFGSTSDFKPDSNRYAYNRTTGGVSTLNLNLPENEKVYNFFGAYINPAALTVLGIGNRSRSRNLSAIGQLGYGYKNLSIGTAYNEAFIPLNDIQGYTSIRNLSAQVAWLLSSEPFFKLPYVSKLLLSAEGGETRSPYSPDNIEAERTQYPDWNNVGLTISDFTPGEQHNRSTRYYNALIDLGLMENNLMFRLNYRREAKKNLFSGSVNYQIANQRFLKNHFSFVSNLTLGASLSNISQLQATAQLMNNNAPLSGGGFSQANANAYLTSLIPAILNKEVYLQLGLFKDRLSLDIRHYHKATSGLVNGLTPADPTSGLGSETVMSEMVNKGWEIYVQGKLLKNKDFSWTATLNGAYNVNIAKKLPPTQFYNDASYLSSPREGYATDALWSYRWAKLDKDGDPQVYNDKNEKILARTEGTGEDPWANSSEAWLVYSGRGTAPWNGGFIHDFNYKHFFARATVLFSMGHVMRKYMPVASNVIDKTAEAMNRWRNEGDEAFTDIAAMAETDQLRTLAIKFSDNSVVPADFIRLQEVQLGCYLPEKWLGHRVKNLSVAISVQNLGLLWAKNKLGIDPGAVATDGRLLPKQPLRYGLSLNLGF